MNSAFIPNSTIVKIHVSLCECLGECFSFPLHLLNQQVAAVLMPWPLSYPNLEIVLLSIPVGISLVLIIKLASVLSVLVTAFLLGLGIPGSCMSGFPRLPCTLSRAGAQLNCEFCLFDMSSFSPCF